MDLTAAYYVESARGFRQSCDSPEASGLGSEEPQPPLVLGRGERIPTTTSWSTPGARRAPPAPGRAAQKSLRAQPAAATAPRRTVAAGRVQRLQLRRKREDSRLKSAGNQEGAVVNREGADESEGAVCSSNRAEEAAERVRRLPHLHVPGGRELLGESARGFRQVYLRGPAEAQEESEEPL